MIEVHNPYVGPGSGKASATLRWITENHDKLTAHGRPKASVYITSRSEIETLDFSRFLTSFGPHLTKAALRRIHGKIIFASSIDSSNTGGLNLMDNGNKTLSVANYYGGNTTLAGGNLTLGNNSALSNGTLIVTNNNSAISAGINNLSVANAISIASGVNAKFSSLAGSNNSTYSGPITLVAASSILNPTTAANTVTTFSGNITGLGGITLAHATATGATVISGNNSYSGNTTLTTGILRIGNNNALGSGTLNNNGIGSSITTVSSDSTTARTLANNISFGTSAQSFFGNATNNGALTFNGTVALNNSTTLTVLSPVAFNGVVSGTNFIMGSSSTSTLTFAGSNTYTGTTTINGGTLSINSIQDGGSATANALGTPTAGANSIIALADTGTLQYIGTGNSSNRVINLTTNKGTYTLDASGPSGTFALTGGITNSGNTNTSLLVLTGSGLGSESGSFANGTGSNTGAVTKNGTGTWTLSGNNTYTGGTTVNAGTLALSGNGTFGTGTLTVSGGTADLGAKSITNTLGALTGGGVVNNGTITNNSSNYNLQNGSVGAVLAGSNGANKTTSSTVTLSGNNTYSGNTTINAGTLVANAANAMQNTSGITVNSGGTLLLNTNGTIKDSATVTLAGGTYALGGAFSETVGSLTLSANSTIDFGAGFGASTLTFNGTYTPTFKLTVSNFDVGDVLILGGNVTSSLSNTSLFSFSGGFTSSYNSGTSLTTITAVPEPGTIAAGLVIVGFIAWRERRRLRDLLSGTLGRFARS